ncbi:MULTISPECIES: ferrichrome porin FhuA [Serratia]|jgi:iron complex outermembrane receptor protein|uniref:Ferrichrome outer membrane transporter n=3 Tax=Serratia TaxID=613 RepID=A0ABC9IMW8_SERMA|nr:MULTISPECIES: ferrichrome porin FhuA [Serratia]QHI79828.1 ferrichrome porin FhuA [Serratia sp. NGAS9]ASM32770.1 ferrichrome porin FhuA [Serratia marcescens]MBE5256385.1 ferrichrome porin FhuA [Serratia marcescens]MBE5300653.1 ferrichrome porin FhuA [Serratia marcescens]MBE5301787.1 ferrichrome porin FhuA [Serratia marcescens]
MPTKRLSSSAAKQGRLPVSALAITVAAALGTLAMPAFSADAKPAAKEDTITVVGGSNSAQQESAWGPVGTYVAKRSATGTKTDTPIEKNPQSVSVVTREEMDMRQPDTVKSALAYAPGVFASRGSSTTYDAVAIRGFPATNTTQYLDGLRLLGDNYSEASIDPYFLERAELLRGPVSVLYGKSNPGGLVSMVSKRPTTEPLREIQFKMGTDNLFQTGFDFSDALDDQGIYSYRLTGLAKDSDTQQNMSKEKRYAIAPSFSWRPDDKTNFTLLANIQNDPYTGYYGWLPKQGTLIPLPDGSKLPTDFNEGEASNYMARKQRMIGYSFEHAFNDTWAVRQNLRYMQVDTDMKSIYGFGLSSPTTINRAYVQSKEHLNNFAVDTQAQAKVKTGDIDHTLLFGVDYSRMRNDINSDYGSTDGLSMTQPQYGNDVVNINFPYKYLNRQEQTGLYLQEQGEWNQWLLTLGGRYDWAKTSANNRVLGYTNERSDGQFTWRGGLNYLFDNGVTPYFSYSESFEPTLDTSINGQTFKPSIGKQYEAGVKYVPKDRPIVLTGALYQLTKNNNLTPDPDNAQFSVQSGEIRSRGVELEAKAALNANVNLIASYTYTDAKYTKDNTYQGKPTVEVPKHMASLWADYTFHETAVSGLTLGSGVRYVGSSSSFNSDNTTFKVPDYTLVDATIKYDLARFGLPGSSVGVNINNLFDKTYVSSCYRDYACYWGAERQVVATATFRF